MVTIADLVSRPCLSRINISRPPSCIQLFPQNNTLIAIGTYVLENNDASASTSQNNSEDSGLQKRTGSLEILQIKGGSLSVARSTPTDFALLDLKFSPFHRHILCAATSTGSLVLWTSMRNEYVASDLPDDPASLDVERRCCLQYFQSSILVLSCSWHPRCPNVIGVTLSTGEVSLVKIPQEALVAAHTFGLKAESLQKVCVFSGILEAWTLSFSPYKDELCSGSDDSVLRIHNVPAISKLFGDDADYNDAIASDSFALREDRRIHGAGVTAILYLSDEIIITGSYDNFIRVLHIPPRGRFQVLAEMDLDGGVWRLNLERSYHDISQETSHTNFSTQILASCMHAGVRVLRVERDKNSIWAIRVVAKFDEHRSMNYGSDSCCDDKSGAITVVSTSFYDSLVCLWRYEPQMPMETSVKLKLEQR